MADIDTAFMPKILHIPKRQWEPDIEHDGQADDLGTGFEVAKWRAFGNPATLDLPPARLKAV